MGCQILSCALMVYFRGVINLACSAAHEFQTVHAHCMQHMPDQLCTWTTRLGLMVSCYWCMGPVCRHNLAHRVAPLYSFRPWGVMSLTPLAYMVKALHESILDSFRNIVKAIYWVSRGSYLSHLSRVHILMDLILVLLQS